MLSKIVAVLLVVADAFCVILFALDHIQLDAVGWELSPTAKLVYRIAAPVAIVIDLLAAYLLWSHA